MLMKYVHCVNLLQSKIIVRAVSNISAYFDSLSDAFASIKNAVLEP